MPAISFAILAMCFYAAQNVIIEQKLKTVEPLLLVAITTGTVCILATWILFAKYRVEGETVSITSEQARLAVICGAILLLGDFSFYSGYKAGAPLLVMTTVPLILPIIASVMKYAITRQGIPTPTVATGWILAAAAVYLVNQK